MFTQYKGTSIPNPYAARTESGEWVEGTISGDFLQQHYGHCKDLDECINATESEGLKLFFEYLKTQQ